MMGNKIEHSEYFSNDGHLNELGTSLYTEALIDDAKFLLLPERVLEHVEGCFGCKKKVIGLYELLKDEDGVVDAIKQQKDGTSGFGKKKSRRLLGFRFVGLSIAASLVLFIAVSAILTYVVKPKHERLFNNYFEPYPNVVTEKGSMLNEDELFNLGMYYYDLKNYDTATIVFNRLLETDSTNGTILFYSGITYLGMGNSREAIVVFSSLKNKESIFSGQILWYCSLSYILQDDYQKAIPILEELKQDRGHYSNRADELLSKID